MELKKAANMQMEPAESLEGDQLHDAVRLYNRCSQVRCFKKPIMIVKNVFLNSLIQGQRVEGLVHIYRFCLNKVVDKAFEGPLSVVVSVHCSGKSRGW